MKLSEGSEEKTVKYPLPKSIEKKMKVAGQVAHEALEEAKQAVREALEVVACEALQAEAREALKVEVERKALQVKVRNALQVEWEAIVGSHTTQNGKGWSSKGERAISKEDHRAAEERYITLGEYFTDEVFDKTIYPLLEAEAKYLQESKGALSVTSEKADLKRDPKLPKTFTRYFEEKTPCIITAETGSIEQVFRKFYFNQYIGIPSVLAPDVLNMRTETRNPILYEAVKRGDIEVVSQLLALGADPRERGGSGRYSSMNLIAPENHEEIRKLLKDRVRELEKESGRGV